MRCETFLYSILSAITDSQPKAHIHGEPDNSLVMQSSFHNSPGEQLYNTYGHMPRAELLRRYGYVTSFAQDDVVDLDLHMIVSAASLYQPHSSDRISFLRKFDEFELDEAYQLGFPRARRTKNLGSELRRLLNLLRILTLDDQGFKAFKKHGVLSRAAIGTPEASVLLNVLLRRLQDYDCHRDAKLEPSIYSHLGSASFTLEPSWLGKASTKRQQMAMEIRISEQRILLAWIKLLRRRMRTHKQMQTRNRPAKGPTLLHRVKMADHSFEMR